MAQVTLTIGDRTHVVACAAGDEPRLQRLGTMLDERHALARRAAGHAGHERELLLIALMLADSLDECQAAPPPPAAVPAPTPAPVTGDALDRVADRLERLADTLEDRSPSA